MSTVENSGVESEMEVTSSPVARFESQLFALLVFLVLLPIAFYAATLQLLRLRPFGWNQIYSPVLLGLNYFQFGAMRRAFAGTILYALRVDRPALSVTLYLGSGLIF
jgi:hypothetical protein